MTTPEPAPDPQASTEAARHAELEAQARAEAERPPTEAELEAGWRAENDLEWRERPGGEDPYGDRRREADNRYWAAIGRGATVEEAEADAEAEATPF